MLHVRDLADIGVKARWPGAVRGRNDPNSGVAIRPLGGIAGEHAAAVLTRPPGIGV